MSEYVLGKLGAGQVCSSIVVVDQNAVRRMIENVVGLWQLRRIRSSKSEVGVPMMYGLRLT